MTIYFDSKTGNVARFVEKARTLTNWDFIKIAEDIEVNQAGHLLTYTTKIGQIPETTSKFMEKHSDLITTVSSSGNRNWGANFGLAANKIAEEYNIPILIKFELAGLESDLLQFIEKIKEHGNKEMDTPQQRGDDQKR